MMRWNNAYDNELWTWFSGVTDEVAGLSFKEKEGDGNKTLVRRGGGIEDGDSFKWKQ